MVACPRDRAAASYRHHIGARYRLPFCGLGVAAATTAAGNGIVIVLCASCAAAAHAKNVYSLRFRKRDVARASQLYNAVLTFRVVACEREF
nr:MAG TPA: hypothetical protein [Caudoviricetes sp.]